MIYFLENIKYPTSKLSEQCMPPCSEEVSRPVCTPEARNHRRNHSRRMDVRSEQLEISKVPSHPLGDHIPLTPSPNEPLGGTRTIGRRKGSPVEYEGIWPVGVSDSR